MNEENEMDSIIERIDDEIVYLHQHHISDRVTDFTTMEDELDQEGLI